ncbi:magnesium transporter CorA family protein [Candidatus Woesearchaeota archaeon]|nr:magnesium transporter CorA family protein [Candidatus Woesearchaeota archaeon]
MIDNISFSKSSTSLGKGIPKTSKQQFFILASRPSQDELTALSKRFNFHKDILSKYKKSSISELISLDPLQFYYVDEQLKDGKINTLGSVIIVAKNALILISSENAYRPYLNRIKSELDSKKNLRNIDYILTDFLEFNTEQDYEILNSIDQEISNIEDTLIDNRSVDVGILLKLKRQLHLVNTNIWKTNQLLYFIKQSTLYQKMPKDRKLNLDDIYHTLQHQMHIIMSMRERVTDMFNIRLSNISNSLNKIMKTLTAITVCLSIPVLFAAVFDTNFINIPLTDHPYGFYFFVVFLIALLASMFSIFYKKNWL